MSQDWCKISWTTESNNRDEESSHAGGFSSEDLGYLSQTVISAHGDKMATYLGFPAPLSAPELPQGLEVCWPLPGHPCLRWGLGTLGLLQHQHL